jgi:hypothetical protein
MKNRFGLEISRGMRVTAAHPRGGDIVGRVSKLARMPAYGWRATLDNAQSVGIDDIRTAAHSYYFAEVTDTFGGDANYCWVRRYKVRADTLLRAIWLVSRANGYSFRRQYDTGDMVRYDARAACVCAFVSHWDADDHRDYTVEILGE